MISTVCDQGTTNKSAVQTKDQFYFLVNNEPVTVLFDIPHLLKNTRNALLTCTLALVAYPDRIQIGYVVDRCPRRQFQTLMSQIMQINLNFKEF